MNVLSAFQMREIDNETINSFGIPGILLMENAGLCCFKVIIKEFPNISNISVICGKGNNGGDGFVLARYLKRYGYNVKVFVLCEEKELKGETLTNYLILKKQYKDILYHSTNDFKEIISSNDLLVDAIFGTGISSGVTGFYSEAIDLINKSSKKVLSVDLPSGINADSGQIMNNAIKADVTVTIGALKNGLLQYPASELSGTVYVADIGFPEKLFTSGLFKNNIASPDQICFWLGKKKKNEHKYSAGTVLIMSGSEIYTGAPCIAAEAALRAGAGMVYVTVPKNIHGIIASKLNEAVVIPYENQNDLKPFLKKADSFVIGMGLDENLLPIAKNLILEAEIPIIIDATAINKNILAVCKNKNVIITPHSGEMARILDIKSSEIEAARMDYAINCAEKFGVNVILKGSNSIITNPDGKLYFNVTGNQAMASAGMGDALSGIIGALAAKNESLFNVAVLSVFVHGAAGDLAAEKSSYGITATDLIDNIPQVIHNINKKDLQLIENMMKFKKISLFSRTFQH